MSDPAPFLRARADEDEATAQAVLAGESDAPCDPARVLREVEAKRAILAEHAPYEVREGPAKGTQACGVETDWNDPWLMVAAWPCPTVRALAAVYRDHPDYDPAWAV